MIIKTGWSFSRDKHRQKKINVQHQNKDTVMKYISQMGRSCYLII